MLKSTRIGFPSSTLVFMVSMVILGAMITCIPFEPDGFLQINTKSVSSLTPQSCEVKGELISIGMEDISAHGFCWSETRNPQLENALSNTLGPREETGEFSHIISNLSSNTYYYLKAYASTNKGFEYGEEIGFKTAPGGASLLTELISKITEDAAECQSEITEDGGATITGRGVCWNSFGTPTLKDRSTSDGVGMGKYNSQLTGLSCNTTYYVRAYAFNSADTVYGNQLIFFSKPCIERPSVVTIAPSAITDSSVYCGGMVTDEGITSVTARGVCWGFSPDPVTDDECTFDGVGSGAFTSYISGLQSNTVYYLRAYASNILGTSYGTSVSFSTEAPGTVPLDYAFAGIGWLNWGDEPQYEGVTGYDGRHFDNPLIVASRASEGWSYEKIIDISSFEDSWKRLGDSLVVANLTSNGVQDDLFDLDSDQPTYGAVWNGVHDGANFYLFLKFWDRERQARRAFDVMFQSNFPMGHKPSLNAASDSSMEQRIYYQNMAYGRYVELGGGNAWFQDGVVESCAATLGLMKTEPAWNNAWTGTWGENDHSYEAFQSASHFWHEDQDGTIRAVLVMSFEGVLGYPANPENMQGAYNSIQVGDIFAFEVQAEAGMEGDGWDETNNQVEHSWAADHGNVWASNYYCGHLFLSSEEIDMPVY